MQVGDSVYKLGWGAPVLEPSYELKLGGKDMSQSLVSWEVSRSYNTDLPEGMRAFSGSSSAQFKYKIDGVQAIKSAPATYGPWAARSTADVTRPNQSVTFKYGYRGSNLASFRGTVRDRSSASGTDEVDATALDGAERLRSAAIVPRPYLTTIWDQFALSPSLVVDNLLRDAGIYSSPPPRYDNLLFVSGHDGMFPYRGDYILTNAQGWTTSRSGAPFSSMQVPVTTVPASATTYYPRKRVTENGLNSSFWMEFFTNNTGIMSNTNRKFEVALTFKDVDPAQDTGTYTWYVDFNAGAGVGNHGLNVVDTGGSSGLGSNFACTQTGVYHFSIFINPNVSTGAIEARMRVMLPDKTYVQTGLITMPTFTAEYNRYLDSISVSSSSVPFENLQVCKTANVEPGATYNDTTQAGQWVRGAKFPDACPYRLQYLPVVEGTKWDTITAIAKATLATAEFDEFGQFWWRECTRFSGNPTEQTVVTSVRDLGALVVKEQIDACRNFVQVSNQDFSALPSSGSVHQYATVGNILVPAGTMASYVFPIDDAFEFDPVTTPRLANTIVSTGNWVTAMDQASGGVDSDIVKTDVEIEGFHNEFRQYQVNVYNMGTASIWLYKSGGTGSGVLVSIPYDDTGFQAAARVTTVQDTTSQSWYGKQSYYHDSGPWIQTASGATTLANQLLSAGAYPIPMLTGVEVLPDARLQLGDVIKLIDRAGNNISQKAWIVGINTSGDAGGVIRQTLILRGVSYPGTPVDSGLTPTPPVDPTVGSTL